MSVFPSPSKLATGTSYTHRTQIMEALANVSEASNQKTIQMTCIFFVGESLRTPSLVLCSAFHIVTEFKKSKVAKAKPLGSTRVTSFTKRFVCPQNWNWRFAHLVDGSKFHSIVHKCSMDHVQVHLLFSRLDDMQVQRLESVVEGCIHSQNKEAENPVPSHTLRHSKDQMGPRPLSTRLETLQVKDSL